MRLVMLRGYLTRSGSRFMQMDHSRGLSWLRISGSHASGLHELSRDRHHARQSDYFRLGSISSALEKHRLNFLRVPQEMSSQDSSASGSILLVSRGTASKGSKFHNICLLFDGLEDFPPAPRVLRCASSFLQLGVLVPLCLLQFERKLFLRIRTNSTA